MVRVLIVTQGQLADELLNAASRIAGSPEHITALSLDHDFTAALPRTAIFFA